MRVCRHLFRDARPGSETGRRLQYRSLWSWHNSYGFLSSRSVIAFSETSELPVDRESPHLHGASAQTIPHSPSCCWRVQRVCPPRFGSAEETSRVTLAKPGG